MTFVVTNTCVECKYTDCVEVCPVDCCMEGPNFLVIDPNGCIDCGVCAPECPVEAIFAEEDLTAEIQPYLAINAEIAGSGRWPIITLKKDTHPEHENYKAVKGKLHLLGRSGV